ncbi:MAG: hypothetical protein JWM41_1756 [Gemmatimonadetes bacterium]|nr:hypothetical protein [Gemmatimonadota bacterium]
MFGGVAGAVAFGSRGAWIARSSQLESHRSRLGLAVRIAMHVRPAVGARSSGTVFPAICPSDGWRTFDSLPSSRMRRNDSSWPGNVSPDCAQCATAASSHQSSSFGIARMCAPEIRYARIDCSSRQTDTVQNTRVRKSGLNSATMNPGACRSCSALVPACQRKPGRYRSPRTRSRVTDTNIRVSMAESDEACDSIGVTTRPAARPALMPAVAGARYARSATSSVGIAM